MSTSKQSPKEADSATEPEVDMSYLDDIHTATDMLAGMSYQLRQLANAHYRLGNVPQADELTSLAQDAVDASKLVNRAVSKEINENLERQQKNTGAILSLALNTIITPNGNPN